MLPMLFHIALNSVIYFKGQSVGTIVAIRVIIITLAKINFMERFMERSRSHIPWESPSAWSLHWLFTISVLLSLCPSRLTKSSLTSSQLRGWESNSSELQSMWSESWETNASSPLSQWSESLQFICITPSLSKVTNPALPLGKLSVRTACNPLLSLITALYAFSFKLFSEISVSCLSWVSLCPTRLTLSNLKVSGYYNFDHSDLLGSFRRNVQHFDS